MSPIVRVAYLPNTVFVHPILNALHTAKKSELRAKAGAWVSSDLGTLGASLSTKITMLGLVADRLYTKLGPLVEEFGKHASVPDHLKRGSVWPPPNRDLPYDALLEFDSFLFEFRSAYEILGKFLVRFSVDVLGEPTTEKELTAVLEERGMALAWIKQLRDHRIFLFHEHAPWIAFEVAATEPYSPEPVFLRHVDSSDSSEVIGLNLLSQIHGGFDRALLELQRWAIAQIARLDATI